jgi:hypothetical protein
MLIKQDKVYVVIELDQSDYQSHPDWQGLHSSTVTDPNWLKGALALGLFKAGARIWYSLREPK